MVSLLQTFVIYVHEQSEVTWGSEDFNWGYIIMFVLALVKGTMKTIQIFKNIFNVGSNRCQEKTFFLTLLFFKISLIITYLHWWFFESDCKRQSLFAFWVTHQKETWMSFYTYCILHGVLYYFCLYKLAEFSAIPNSCYTGCTFSFTLFIWEVFVSNVSNGVCEEI